MHDPFADIFYLLALVPAGTADPPVPTSRWLRPSVGGSSRRGRARIFCNAMYSYTEQDRNEGRLANTGLCFFIADIPHTHLNPETLDTATPCTAVVIDLSHQPRTD